MAQLEGFDDYKQDHVQESVFPLLAANGNRAVWHLHGNRVVIAAVAAHADYEVTLQPAAGDPITEHKTQVKFLHDPSVADDVPERVKVDSDVRSRGLAPILRHHGRHVVKNKTLFVAMRERTVVKCTLLEGEILRGLVTDFSRYEVRMHLKGSIPVTILRHAILDLRDKQDLCLLKDVQDQRRDWQRSALYIGGGGQNRKQRPSG